MLTKNTINTKFSNNYNDNNITITINKNNTKIDVLNDKIIVKANLEGKILENNTNYDLKNPKTYEQLNKDFEMIIEESITKFIKKLQFNNSDILGIENIYYKKYNKDYKKLWTVSDIQVDVDLKINTKGFIFEVTNEK